MSGRASVCFSLPHPQRTAAGQLTTVLLAVATTAPVLVEAAAPLDLANGRKNAAERKLYHHRRQHHHPSRYYNNLFADHPPHPYYFSSNWPASPMFPPFRRINFRPSSPSAAPLFSRPPVPSDESIIAHHPNALVTPPTYRHFDGDISHLQHNRENRQFRVPTDQRTESYDGQSKPNPAPLAVLVVLFSVLFAWTASLIIVWICRKKNSNFNQTTSAGRPPDSHADADGASSRVEEERRLKAGELKRRSSPEVEKLYPAFRYKELLQKRELQQQKNISAMTLSGSRTDSPTAATADKEVVWRSGNFILSQLWAAEWSAAAEARPSAAIGLRSKFTTRSTSIELPLLLTPAEEEVNGNSRDKGDPRDSHVNGTASAGKTRPLEDEETDSDREEDRNHIEVHELPHAVDIQPRSSAAVPHSRPSSVSYFRGGDSLNADVGAADRREYSQSDKRQCHHQNRTERSTKNDAPDSNCFSTTEKLEGCASTDGSAAANARDATLVPDFNVVFGEDSIGCAICLSVVNGDDYVRVLACLHVFHQNCVDIWLRKHSDCPLCKRCLFPPALSADESAANHRQRLNTSGIAPFGSVPSVAAVRPTSRRISGSLAAVAATEENSAAR